MVIKADVQGSAEALADAVRALKTENASVDVLRAGKTDTVIETERQRDRETERQQAMTTLDRVAGWPHPQLLRRTVCLQASA